MDRPWSLPADQQPVREAVLYRGLFTAGWFGVREKHCSRLEIYDRLRASEQGQATDDCIAQRVYIYIWRKTPNLHINQ